MGVRQSACHGPRGPGSMLPAPVDGSGEARRFSGQRGLAAPTHWLGGLLAPSGACDSRDSEWRRARWGQLLSAIGYTVHMTASPVR